MKTNELIGAQLDYWIAQAEGIEVVLWANEGPREQAACVLKDRRPNAYPTHYQPSINWAWGGPIVELEKIATECPRGGQWVATIWTGKLPEKFIEGTGDTLLVAAMRCYVASKFGAEIHDETGSAA